MAASRPVRIPPLNLAADLAVPARPRGLVIFAHGSGSSRLSPRNRWVADALGRAGYATLLFDLLTEAEAVHRANVFDIDLLAQRLASAIDWAGAEPELASLPIGLFGASTGAAAALVAASEVPEKVAAVVSRGGRPDLAGDALEKVKAPTLLLVGGLDRVVIGMNEDALARLTCEKKLEVIPGASHLFEEPGTLEAVANAAAAWFIRYLRGGEGS